LHDESFRLLLIWLNRFQTAAVLAEKVQTDQNPACLKSFLHYLFVMSRIIHP